MRFVRLYGVLTAVLSGAVLAIHLIGGLYPNPIAVLFTNPDGSPCQMPCLFGVRPGEMTVDEGLQVLGKHPLTQGMTTRNSELGIVVYSRDAWINFAVGNHQLIAAINLAYHAGMNGSTTPELVSAMQYAVPGNQVLYFGASPDNVSKSIKPPYVYERCYAANMICFANQQEAYTDPWQSELWLGLDAFRRSAK